MSKKYILCGFTALRAMRKLRIDGYCFRELLETDVRLPSKEEVQKLNDFFNFSGTSLQYCQKNNYAQEMNFLVDAKCRQKPLDNQVFTHHSGSWKGVIAEPVQAKNSACYSNQISMYPKNLGLVTPEFLLLQLSQHLSFEELLLLALEFCGTFAVYRNFSDTKACTSTTDTENTVKDAKLYTGLQPIMSLNNLEALLRVFSNSRINGIVKLKSVEKYLRPFSASPMESRLFANLVIPTRMGGFNLSNLEFNYPIQLSSVAASVAQQQKVIVDLCDIRKKTVIEYDSRTFHSEIDQSQKDKRRRDGLEIDKFKCFSITTDQINNFDTFYNYARQFVWSIKGRVRIRAKNFEENAFSEYSALRKASFKVAML